MNKTYTFLLLIVLIFQIPVLHAQEMDFYWAKQFGNDYSSNDIQSIASDNMNKIIAFSHFSDEFSVEETNHIAEDGLDLILFSISEDGEVEWSFSGGGNNDQEAQEVHCDSFGNIYIMGKFKYSIDLDGHEILSNGSFDMFIAKYSPQGEFVWLKTFGGPNSEAIESMKIKSDKIILGGRFYDFTILGNDTIFSNDGTDFFIAKMNLDGEFTAIMSAGGESVDKVSGIDMDLYGNVYAIGDFYQDIQLGDEVFEAGEALGLYMIKLNPDLDIVWAYQFVGNDLKPEAKIAVSSDGNITVAGSFSDNLDLEDFHFMTNEFDEDLFAAHFNPNGEVVWAHHFYSNSMESVQSLQVDRVGNTYISGHYLDTIHFADISLDYHLCCGDPEIFFVKIDNSGSIVNANQLTGERSRLKTMVVPEINQVILAGQFSEDFAIGDFNLHSPTSYNVYIAYYKDDTWLYNEPIVDRLNLTIHPNPFQEYFLIPEIPAGSSIQVYNQVGKMIEIIEIQSNNQLTGKDWSSGLYFLAISFKSGDTKFQKVIKL